MKHLRKFEAFVDARGELHGLSKNISINGKYFEFDLYDVDLSDDITYIEGKIYFKPDVEEYEGTIIYDKSLDKCFTELPEEFFSSIEHYRAEFQKFCLKVKNELIR